MSAALAAPRVAVDLEGPVTDGFRSFMTFIPRFLGFLAVLVVGYLLAKAVAKVVDVVLERVGFDRAVERGGIRQALARSQYDASDVVAKIAFYFVFIAALSLSLGVLGIQALEAPMAALLALLPKVLVALVVVVVGAAIAAGAKTFLGNVLGGLSYGRAVASATSVLILLLFAKAALDEVGIATTVTGPLLYAVLATAAGIAIVGVGGGLIKPMQARWEDVLDRASEETRAVKAQVQGQQAPYPLEGYPQDGAEGGFGPATTETTTATYDTGRSRRR